MAAEYATIDCCPVDTRLLDELKVLKDDTGCVYQSIYRGQDPAAQKYLTGAAPCFKHNQAWIYAHYPPGVANPPGRSTHECRNDGVAYPGAIGAVLEYWQVGLDIDDAHVAAFIAAARKRGWIATITYPGSAVEYHHVNFRKEPEFDVFVALKVGDSGDRVAKLIEKLAFIHRPHKYGDAAYLPKAGGSAFTDDVARAVKRFQADHHLGTDGIVGTNTWQQILVSERQEKQNRAVNALKADLADVEKSLQQARDDRLDADHDGDQDRVKKLDAEIKDLGTKADALRKQIREAGGNPSTP